MPDLTTPGRSTPGRSAPDGSTPDSPVPDRTPPGRPKGPRAGGLSGLVRWDTVVGALLMVLLLCSFGFVDNFGNALNLSFLIGNTLPIALIALPMTMLVVAGEIDLSVGSVAGLSGAVMGALWNHGMAIETIIPLCLLLGLVCGLVNGLLVTRLGLPSLAVTIGTMAAYRGIAQIVLGSNSVTDFPQPYLDFGSGRIGGTFVPYAAIPWGVLAVIAIVVLHAGRVGRSLFAIGASEEAARFTGIRVKRLRLAMFATTGPISALTGVFWVLHYASARYDNATGLELSVIAAVLLGGVDFDGGRGTLGGAIAGVFLLGTLQNTMSLVNVSAQSQTVVTGVLLVFSVLGPRVGRRIVRARARQRATAAPVGATPLGSS
jgi:rhamnose transport system permease protein